MARVQTLVLRDRFSIVVVLRKANWREERVMPRVKRAKRPALGKGLVSRFICCRGGL